MSRPAPCTFAESHFSLWSVRNAPAKVPVPTTGTWCILQALTCIRLSYFYPAWLPEFPAPGREELGGDWRRFNPDRSEEIGRGSIKPVTQSWSAWRRAFLSCASSCVSLKPCLRFYGKKKRWCYLSICRVLYTYFWKHCEYDRCKMFTHLCRSKDVGLYLKVIFWLVWSLLGHPPEPRRGVADLDASAMVRLTTTGLGYLGLPGNLLRW